MAKKQTAKKAPKIETIKLGIHPNNTVTHEGIRYTVLANGNYLNNSTSKEVKLVY